jgi:hypothetical protein
MHYQITITMTMAAKPPAWISIFLRNGKRAGSMLAGGFLCMIAETVRFCLHVNMVLQNFEDTISTWLAAKGGGASQLVCHSSMASTVPCSAGLVGLASQPPRRQSCRFQQRERPGSLVSSGTVKLFNHLLSWTVYQLPCHDEAVFLTDVNNLQ